MVRRGLLSRLTVFFLQTKVMNRFGRKISISVQQDCVAHDKTEPTKEKPSPGSEGSS